MHWLWIICISVEVILMLWATMIERHAIINRISGANGFIWFSLMIMCVIASIIAMLASWAMVSGIYALKVAGGAAVLHFFVGGVTLTYLADLGNKVAKKNGLMPVFFVNDVVANTTGNISHLLGCATKQDRQFYFWLIRRAGTALLRSNGRCIRRIIC